jgi:hypothetical protein
MRDDSTRPPVVCDLTGAPDTAAERLAEYARLFDRAYLSRERTADGVRWRLRADPGVEEWARDLAAREMACCPFMTLTVVRVRQEIHWDATTFDDAAARAVLGLFHDLPARRWETVEAVMDRWPQLGVPKGAGTSPPTA